MSCVLRLCSKNIRSEGLWPQLICCAPFPSIAPYFRTLYSDLQNRYNVWYFFSVHIMAPVYVGITLYVGEIYWGANSWLHVDAWIT
jgi:hypothetical protein